MDNVSASKEIKFLIFCIEEYKLEKGLRGSQTLDLFTRYGVSDYILACYEALHTTGRQYLMEDIDGFIKERQTA